MLDLNSVILEGNCIDEPFLFHDYLLLRIENKHVMKASSEEQKLITNEFPILLEGKIADKARKLAKKDRFVRVVGMLTYYAGDACVYAQQIEYTHSNIPQEEANVH